ncbi:MAG: ComEC/Rec2 family competence protein [Oscillospiraceae bacterium]|nr:ComEC/Rec2 family competence protein [Oscillospiraceae bacterium]
MAYVGSSYLVGLFFASFLSSGVSVPLASAVGMTSAAMPAVLGKKYICAAVCLISGALAMLLYGICDVTVYRNVVKYDGYDVEVNGIIRECTERSGDKSSYIVDGVINDDVRAKVICYTDDFGGEIGDPVSLIGTAEALKDSYTFSSQSYYKAKGIYLRINNVKYVSCKPGKGFSLFAVVNRYRSHIIKTVSEYMDEDGQGVMAAMLFGDKSDLESSQKTLMYRAGIGHIMAVSGVHLTVICAFFSFFISRLPINKYCRFGLLLVPISCFVLLAGMSNSVIRAAVMLIIVYGAGLFRRQSDVFNSLGIAVILLTVTDPFAVRDASFLLSAAGVFGIGVAAPQAIKLIEEKHKLGAIAKSAVMSLCVTLVVFPVSMLYFDEVSVMSPISNLLLLPICELILIGGLIVTLTGGVSVIAVPVLKICGFLCDIVLEASRFIGGLHFSYIPLGSDVARLSAIAAAVLIAVIFLRTRKADVTSFAAVTILLFSVISINVYRIVPDGNITVAVIKNGSSSAAVIHDKKSASVIDLTKSGKASSAVVKYLNRNGIYKINTLILTDGADTSFPVYMEAFDLFQVSTVLIPEDSLNKSIRKYHTPGEIKIDRYTVSFIDDETFTVSCLGDDILFYCSGFSGAEDREYAAAVRYSGADPSTDVSAGIMAALSDSARIVAEKDEDIYIGESVKMVIASDGTIRSAAID